MNKINVTDLSNDFSAHPLTGDVAVKKDIDAIKQSMKNLLLMNKFDKPFRPDIDAGLRELLFENYPTPILDHLIQQKVNYIISNYEPRVIIKNISINPNELDDNLLQLSITFTLSNSNTIEPNNLTIFLERVR